MTNRHEPYFLQPVLFNHLVNSIGLGRQNSGHVVDLVKLLRHADQALSSNKYFSGVITNNKNRGVARIFQRGGGVTLCQTDGTHQIVMSFLPPIVGCLLEKSLQKGGGGHGHPRTPLATPLKKLFACPWISLTVLKPWTFSFLAFQRLKTEPWNWRLFVVVVLRVFFAF